MKAFVSKHAGEVIGVLSGFDRLVFRGTLRLLAHHLGMQQYLWAMQVLLKDFANHAEAVTRQLREASEAHARSTGRPIHFMPSSASSKEERARTIAQQDGIEQGLICIHLIRKVPHTHRYQLTDAGRIAVTALLTARRVSTQQLTKLAA